MNNYIVYINKLNLLESPYIKDATIALKISEEEYLKTRSFKAHEAWEWNPNTQTFNLITQRLLIIIEL